MSDLANLMRNITIVVTENAQLQKQNTQLQRANNREVERRRLAEDEARRCRTALVEAKLQTNKEGLIPPIVVGRVIDPALAGHDVNKESEG